jgi:glucosamine-6-phosphate deaminase
MQTCTTINANSRIKVVLWEGEHQAPAIGKIFIDLIRSNNETGRDTVLCMPWGPTRHLAPIIEAHRAGLDLSRVKTFNLDEWVGPDGRNVSTDKPYSFRAGMEQRFLARFDPDEPKAFRRENMHFPDAEHPERFTEMIEQAGGFDLAYLGVGDNGHIAFNEPPELEDEYTPEEYGNLPTRVVRMTPKSILQNFHGMDWNNLEYVPSRAVTMGMREILDARRIIVAAQCRPAVMYPALLGPVTPMIPASYLQRHPDCTFFVSEQVFSHVAERRVSSE